MDLTGVGARLRRWATPRPLVVTAPGAHRCRWAVERELRLRGWGQAASPGEADLLVVCGTPGPQLADAVEQVWQQLSTPRARAQIPHPDQAAAALDGARTELSDAAWQRRDLLAPSVDGDRPVALFPAIAVGAMKNTAPVAAVQSWQRGQLVDAAGGEQQHTAVDLLPVGELDVEAGLCSSGGMDSDVAQLNAGVADELATSAFAQEVGVGAIASNEGVDGFAAGVAVLTAVADQGLTATPPEQDRRAESGGSCTDDDGVVVDHRHIWCWTILAVLHHARADSTVRHFTVRVRDADL